MPIVKKYEPHAIADIYPLASQKEFELLKASISSIGQEHPIIVYDKKILDGRNRYRACKELDIEPQTKEFEGSYDEAFKYATELNSARRHTNKSQQAMMAAQQVLRSRVEEGKDLSVAKAARVFNVSPKYIKRAIAIKLSSDLIANNIFNGSMTIINGEQSVQTLMELDGEKTNIENSTPTPEDDRYSQQEIDNYYNNFSHEDLVRKLRDCLKIKIGY